MIVFTIYLFKTDTIDNFANPGLRNWAKVIGSWYFKDGKTAKLISFLICYHLAESGARVSLYPIITLYQLKLLHSIPKAFLSSESLFSESCVNPGIF